MTVRIVPFVFLGNDSYQRSADSYYTDFANDNLFNIRKFYWDKLGGKTFYTEPAHLIRLPYAESTLITETSPFLEVTGIQANYPRPVVRLGRHPSAAASL